MLTLPVFSAILVVGLGCDSVSNSLTIYGNVAGSLQLIVFIYGVVIRDIFLMPYREDRVWSRLFLHF